MAPINQKGQPARYITGHNRPALGVPKRPESIAQRTATRRAKNGGSYWSDGKSPTQARDHEKWLASMSTRPRPDFSGTNGPFYGKTHTAASRALMSEALSGERHPQWKGGTATLPYGPEFTKKFKALIRQRDGNRCTRCGKTRDEVGRTLHVHHIDFSQANNDPTNLASLCYACHRVVHPQKQRRWG